ncbi:transposase [Pyruvatibacter mobilis]|uniref:transposase n=1 Tax=Pyruvatibacter mobilis TaxID=1712261 RepID=UPI003BAA5880
MVPDQGNHTTRATGRPVRRRQTRPQWHLPVLRFGALWRDLPERYGVDTTCYNRFMPWRIAGVQDRILAAISRRDNADVQTIDSTIVRARQHATCI